MTTKNKLGIWMDHANAHLVEFSPESSRTETITSKFTHESKEKTLEKGENAMHNKEQHQNHEYYKKLGETIRNYDEVVLYGPTEAKSELLNILHADHLFEKIKITTEHADRMTDIQQHAFVKNYFTKK